LRWKDCPEEEKEGRFKQAAQPKKKNWCVTGNCSHNGQNVGGWQEEYLQHLVLDYHPFQGE